MPLGLGNLVCAHSTTILTNHESSELVGECIFMPSRLGHGPYKKIDRLKNIFIVYSVIIVWTVIFANAVKVSISSIQ